VNKIVDGSQVGLDTDDIASLLSIVPTAEEQYDWERANNGFRDPKEDAGNEGTDWLDSL
jgi:hypothetical protein